MSKKKKLQTMLEKRRIPGEVVYARKGYQIGWMWVLNDNWETRQRLGFNFHQAKSLIEKGILELLVE